MEGKKERDRAFKINTLDQSMILSINRRSKFYRSSLSRSIDTQQILVLFLLP